MAFVTSAKNRRKFLVELHRATTFLQLAAFKQVTGLEEQVLRQALRAHGLTTDTCYLISEAAHLDGQRPSLSEAMRAVVGWGMATLLVFGNAQLVYYEGEGKNVRYLSR